MCYTEGANTRRRACMEKHSPCEEKDRAESVCSPRKMANRGRSSVRRKWHGERGRNIPSHCAVGERNSPVTGVSQSEGLLPTSGRESEQDAGNITIGKYF